MTLAKHLSPGQLVTIKLRNMQGSRVSRNRRFLGGVGVEFPRTPGVGVVIFIRLRNSSCTSSTNDHKFFRQIHTLSVGTIQQYNQRSYEYTTQ